MMQPELLQPSWPLYNIIDPNLHQAGLFGDHEFSPSITTTEDSSGSYFPTIFSDGFVEFPFSGDEMELTFPMENIETISGSAIEDMCRWLEENESEGNHFPPQLSMEGEDVWSPKSSEASVVLLPQNPSLELPRDGMEIDNQLSLHHLLEAYREAMEMGQRELAVVIKECIKDRASQLGQTLERVTFNLFQSTEKQGDYLKQESSKNFELAFKAFYEIFPYGRFAHFAANAAILEGIPDEIETIHIVDFDMGEGIQWASMIEAIGNQQKALILTSIKQEEGQDCYFAPSKWRFEETKRRLYDHARSFGLKLKVEEMGIGELKRRGSGREIEWLAFNCMVGFPHMGGKRRSRSHVMEFLRVAKELLLANSATGKGVITFGDGEDGERMKTCSGCGSFFDGKLKHYQSVCESMEWNFPTCLTEARMAMETLFVAPYVSSLSWFQEWEEGREGSVLEAGVWLQGWRLGKDSLMEAKEMVKEGESSYKVRIEGENGNEMVLEWRGTPLVRVSTWV